MRTNITILVDLAKLRFFSKLRNFKKFDFFNFFNIYNRLKYSGRL